MHSYDRFVKDFFGQFDRFTSKKYVTDENRFIRKRKMNQKEYTAFILSQRSCTGYIETIRFFTMMMNEDFKTITSQAIGKQRKYIDPKAFIDMYECFIDELYSKFSGFSKFKEYIVCACDGSIIYLPNVSLTREEFPLGDENLLKENRIRARVSCFLDVHSKHILTAKIVETTTNEVKLAIEHLDNLKKRLDIKKSLQSTIADIRQSSLCLKPWIWTQNF